MFESYLEDVPARMKALQLTSYDGVDGLACVEVDVPQPREGQVLLRVLASPINPSDVMFTRGLYGFRNALPTTPGFEGCGVVVASGGGMPAKALHGRRVAVLAGKNMNGLWAEYMLVDHKACFPVKSDLTDAQAATMLINPMTAYALVERAVAQGHRALIQNAAAGALGRMIARIAEERGLPVIHLVRRDEQASALIELGAQWVINSTADDADEELRELSHTLGATLALDAVAGHQTARLLAAMPARSTAVVYGALSERPSMINPGDLIFGQKQVEGFWLASWLGHTDPRVVTTASKFIQDRFDSLFHTDIQGTFALEAFRDAFAVQSRGTTKGKLLFSA